MLSPRNAASWLIWHAVIVLVACFSLGAAADGTDSASLLFESYYVPLHKITRFAPTRIPDSGLNWKMQDYLRFSDKEPLNFAGKYTLFKIGCGTNCVEFCLIDRTTGIVHPGMSFNTFFPIDYKGPWDFEYRLDSRLLVVYHSRGFGDPVLVDYYAWDGTAFILLKTARVS
ncbi:MAG: hypothetical protein FWG81_05310 [Betaproteobacteria bacterium]|nr:hypothetical protein [Betaproteobacteria bacterium]